MESDNYLSDVAVQSQRRDDGGASTRANPQLEESNKQVPSTSPQLLNIIMTPITVAGKSIVAINFETIKKFMLFQVYYFIENIF